jgi:hypothetical protein
MLFEFMKTKERDDRDRDPLIPNLIFRRVRAMLENHFDLTRDALLAVLYRWRRLALVAHDVPGLYVLRLLGAVEIKRPVHEHDLCLVFQFTRYEHVESLPDLVWKVGEAHPVAIARKLVRKMETMHFDADTMSRLHGLATTSGDLSTEFERRTLESRRISFVELATMELLQSQENEDASAIVGQDAKDLDQSLWESDYTPTRVELGAGIDAATADLDWALNVIGPPPSPTGTTSRSPSPLGPLGSTS